MSKEDSASSDPDYEGSTTSESPQPSECKQCDYALCEKIDRLFNALKLYSSLKIMTNEQDKETFERSMANEYPDFIDEYNHFKDVHNDHLEEIYTDLTENKRFVVCDIRKCEFTSRHYQRRDLNEENERQIRERLGSRLNLYKHHMDSLHFGVFHVFDVGLRTRKEVLKDRMDDFDDTKDDKYFDAVFDRIHKSIGDRTRITSSFDRFSTKNSKYNIATGLDEQSEIKKGKLMFLDHLFKYLLRHDMHDIEIKALIDFINHQQYDTDSIKFDHRFQSNGNVVKIIENKTGRDKYDDIISTVKVSESSFSVGMRYYYWAYYQLDVKDMGNMHQKLINEHPHSGYSYKELFVVKKYGDFKEEIANYDYISFRHFTDEVMVKVTEYLQTNYFKKTVATKAGTRELRYDIEEDEPIKLQHLLALTLYTDFTDLCTAFSATFRKKNVFETLESMIERNRDYYWMSRCLRECVEIYGQNGLRDSYYVDERYDEDGSWLEGPYYSGVSVVLSLTNFSLRLCGPTSTSKQIEVAMKFSGVEGMVIQLNNTNIYPHNRLFGFDASIISRYREEDERVWCGGLWPIQIQSVRIRSTKQNFEEFIYNLYCLDLVLNAGNSKDINTNEMEVDLIKDLMHKTLSEDAPTKYTIDDYIINTFGAFAMNKTKIILNLEYVYKLDARFRDLLMNPMQKQRHKKDKGRKSADDTNIFRSQILEVFKNVKSVIIYSNYNNRDKKFSFSVSMMHLLSLIDANGVQELSVKAYSYGEYGDFNWIRDVWKKSSSKLQDAYRNKKYDISKKQDGDNMCELVVKAL